MADRQVAHLMSVLCAHRRTCRASDCPPVVAATASALRLSLSNAAVLDLPIGEMIGEFLAARISLASGPRSSIVCALHEAALNAVLHGNLAITSRGRCAAAGVDDLHREIEARLADPAACARRCDIRVRWTAAAILARVSDQGAGFAPTRAPRDATLPYGRGIGIIIALTAGARWTRGGRSLLMRFAR